MTDKKCRKCKGKKYVGTDGHTCEHCDGSGYEIEDAFTLDRYADEGGYMDMDDIDHDNLRSNWGL